jgi:membrane protease YdiL (CAAX protease family)
VTPLFIVFSVIYTLIVWFSPSVFWHYKSDWFKNTAKRFRHFLLAFNLCIFILYVLVPILVVTVVENKSLAFMGFFLPSLSYFLLFTLVPYALLLVFTLLETWYRATQKHELMDNIAPLPKSYPKEALDQILSVAFPEEVLQRGYLLPHLLEALNPISAIGTSALIFSLLHVLSGGKYRALRTIVDGIVLAIVFMCSGILTCMAIHLAGNLFSARIQRVLLGKYPQIIQYRKQRI